MLEGLDPALPAIDLSLGEPKALIPDFLGPTLEAHLAEFGRYPPIKGIPALRQAIAAWLGRRYPVLDGRIDAETHVLPLNGSREGLFSAIFPALARKPEVKRPAVLIPNPFYQAYAAAAAASGAEPEFLPSLAETDFLPELELIDEAPAATDRRLLSLHAVKSARRRGRPRLSRARHRARAALRLSSLRRRMLFRDL